MDVQLITEKPKRPWFRFHLLTAVLMMFAAGVAMALSFRERAYYTDDWSSGAYDAAQTVGVSRGWPLPFDVTDNRDVGSGNIIIFQFHHWSYAYLAIDILALVPVLAVVGFVCEYIIRRREARKP